MTTWAQYRALFFLLGMIREGQCCGRDPTERL
jgi:hypothetical protein